MSRIKITQAGSGGPTHSHGVTIEVNGVPVTEVTDIQLSFSVDSIAECRIQTYLEAPFEFDGDAQVIVENPRLPEGCCLREVMFHGRRHYIVTRITPEP